MEKSVISKKLAIGFVLFNPSDLFFKRLTCFNDIDIEIYVFDNSPKSFLKEQSDISKNVKIISSKGNLGLGKGLNSLGKYAYSQGKEALLYFDQDTVFDKNSIAYINEYFIDNRIKFDKLASIFFTNKNKKTRNQTRYVIMPHHSGMLFNLKNLKLVGWHNKNIFLDVLDYDYCLEVRRKKLKILEVNNIPGIDHQSHQDADLIPLFNKTFNLSRIYSRKRVFDTLLKTILLSARSLLYMDFIYFAYLLRFFMVYSFFQLYARFYSIFRQS